MGWRLGVVIGDLGFASKYAPMAWFRMARRADEHLERTTTISACRQDDGTKLSFELPSCLPCAFVIFVAFGVGSAETSLELYGVSVVHWQSFFMVIRYYMGCKKYRCGFSS